MLVRCVLEPAAAAAAASLLLFLLSLLFVSRFLLRLFFFFEFTFGYFVSSNRTRFVETCANKLEPELLDGMRRSGWIHGHPRNKLDEGAECRQKASLPER